MQLPPTTYTAVKGNLLITIPRRRRPLIGHEVGPFAGETAPLLDGTVGSSAGGPRLVQAVVLAEPRLRTAIYRRPTVEGLTRDKQFNVHCLGLHFTLTRVRPGGERVIRWDQNIRIKLLDFRRMTSFESRDNSSSRLAAVVNEMPHAEKLHESRGILAYLFFFKITVGLIVNRWQRKNFCAQYFCNVFESKLRYTS